MSKKSEKTITAGEILATTGLSFSPVDASRTAASIKLRVPLVQSQINALHYEGYNVEPAHPDTTGLLLHIGSKAKNCNEVIEAASKLVHSHMKGIPKTERNEVFNKLAKSYGYIPQEVDKPLSWQAFIGQIAKGAAFPKARL